MDALESIQKALDLIEKGLTEPLTLTALSRRVGMSPWHFQRTFSAMVGAPVGSYLRRRRLTEAARRLQQTRATILDVALDFQFDSHEAFTRAFKAEMNLTPNAWRRGESAFITCQHRLYVTAQLLQKRYGKMKLIPEIVTLPARTFVGLQCRFISVMSPDANNLIEIPKLWDKFNQRIQEVETNEPKASYGLCGLPERHGEKGLRPDELLYLAAVQVDLDSAVPSGMKRWVVPAGMFAKFTHRGIITRIGETMGFIYGKWFPASDYERGRGPEFERYDHRFNSHSETSEMDVYIPLRAKT